MIYSKLWRVILSKSPLSKTALVNPAAPVLLSKKLFSGLS
jgi:hypothetical protein